MQLSASTTTPDPSLAALLLGNAVAGASLAPDANATAGDGDGFAQLLADATPAPGASDAVAVAMPTIVPTPLTVPALWPFVGLRTSPVESFRSTLPPTDEPVVMASDIEGDSGDAATETPPKVNPSRPGRVTPRREGAKPSIPAAVPMLPVEAFTVPLFSVILEAPVGADEILTLPDATGDQWEQGSDKGFLTGEESAAEVAPRFDAPRGHRAFVGESARKTEPTVLRTTGPGKEPAAFPASKHGVETTPLPPPRSSSAPQRAAATPGPELSAGGEILSSQIVTPVAPRPLGRPVASADPATAPRLESHGENFAVPMVAIASDEKTRANESAKTFVSASEKQLTSHLTVLGTGVAKTPGAMPSVSTSPRSLRASTDSVAGELTDVSFLNEVTAPTAALTGTFAPETLSAAHRAVDAVLTAAHRFTAGERHAVNLQFSVGGVDLNVRVELRADEVRTTFQTDSAELRAALSSEWQSVGTAAPDRALRLATPVFTSTDATGFSASAGDSASQQRHAPGRPTEENLVAALRGGSRRTPSVDATSIVPVTPRAALSTALHLHTLA